MVDIGRWNRLRVVRVTDFGLYLDAEQLGDILLPNKLIPADLNLDEIRFDEDELDVFVCYDSEDRLMATTENVLAQVGELAVLQVKETNSVGAFLNWGLSKDLFLPFAEQSHNIRPWQHIVVAVYLDKSDRLCASMRVERYLDKVVKFNEDGSSPLSAGQEVDLIVYARTDMGYKTIVNNQYVGFLYENEVFKPLNYADQLKGFIAKVREDGKLDLNLQRQGHQAGLDIVPLLIQKLENENGFLAITDKTASEEIYKMFGVSKKKFKIALGNLYKQRVIAIEDNGIRLVKPLPVKKITV